MKLSIIVPVYNISLYLEKCLDSIICEKSSNIEIILVDDGSADASGLICEKYKKKDSRIKVIYQKNMGLSMARNNGIKKAIGEYIFFVDGDDYLEQDYYQVLLPYLNSSNDIIVFNYNRIDDNKKYPIKSFYNYEDVSTKYLLSHCMAWNKVFKRSILDKKMFPKGRIYEDLYSVPLLIKKTKNIIFVDKYLYNYVNRVNSIVNSKGRLEDRVFAMKNLYNNLNDKYFWEIEYLYIYNLILPTIYENHDLRFVNILVKEKYPKYFKNKYLKWYVRFYLILVYYNLTFLAKLIIYFKRLIYGKN